MIKWLLNKSQNDYVTVKEAAEILRTNRMSIYRAIAKGKIPKSALKEEIISVKRVLIKKSELKK